MKHICISVFLILGICSLSAAVSANKVKSQSASDSTLIVNCQILAEQTQELHDLAVQVVALSDAVVKLQQQVDSAREAWKNISSQYINSEGKNLDEISLLIAQTDSVAEADVYAMLTNARKELKNNCGSVSGSSNSSGEGVAGTPKSNKNILKKK